MALTTDRRGTFDDAHRDGEGLRRSVLVAATVLTAGLVLSWLLTALLMRFVRGTLENMCTSAA